MGDHVREVVQIFRGGVRASAIPGYMGARRAACSRALVHLEGVRGSRCQCRGQAGRASTSPGEAGRGRASAGEPWRGRANPGESGRGRAEAGRPRPRVILGPDRGRPAGRWRGLRQGASQDADVGGRQDARPPARARPGGAGRVQARSGEGRRGPAMPGRLASASLSICWPGRGGRRSAGAGCAGRAMPMSGGRQDARPPARARTGAAGRGLLRGVRPGDGTARGAFAPRTSMANPVCNCPVRGYGPSMHFS